MATANVTGSECPEGHFCIAGSIKPQPCPPGTYLDKIKGLEEQDCIPCIDGYYCPLGSPRPIECTPGNFCPSEAMMQKTCRGGYYCNKETRF